MTRLYWQQEWPMLSYSIYVVCSLYVTFLLPPERAPKVLAPSLFFLHSYSIIIALANGLGNKFEFEISFHQLFYTCYIHNIHVYTSQCMAPQGPTYLKNHSLVPVSLSLIHHHNQTDTLCIHYNLYNTEHQYIT